MSNFYPVCVTLALFIALILFDIMERTPEKVTPHTFAGLIILFLMVYLSFKDMELVSWGLLLIPTVVLITCYFLGKTSSSVTKSPAPVPSPVVPTPAPIISSCSAPTIASPESLATAKTVIDSNNMCNMVV